MVFGLFSKGKSLEKTIAKATNKLSQQVDRWAALEKLKEDGSEEALLGLCRRFGITSTKGVEDEAEKNWVVDTLVGVGASALPPLVRYMAKAWPTTSASSGASSSGSGCSGTSRCWASSAA